MQTRWLLSAIAGLLVAATAHAKLPPPTLTPEQQAKAAEAAARTAWSNKVADFQLCRSMDRVAAHYQADVKKRGSTPPALDPAPPACVDPGPFVAPSATPAVAAAAPAPAAAPQAATAAAPAKK